MKKCPFCAEEIQDDAIKCRFCNEILVGNPILQKHIENPEGKKAPWYFNGIALWLSYFVFLPISVFWCVPLVWMHPTRSKTNKVTISLIMIVIALIAALVVKVSVQTITKYYGTIFQGSGIGL